MNVPEDTVCLATVGKFVPDLQIHNPPTHTPPRRKQKYHLQTLYGYLAAYLKAISLLFLKTENTFLNRLIVKFTKLLAF